MKILMVLTSHDRIEDSEQRTGLWLEELAAPYYRFLDSGATIVLASPYGGPAPIDPRSQAPEAQTEATRRFEADPAAQEALAHTRLLQEIKTDDIDAVFYPGGHGPVWDLAEDESSLRILEDMIANNKPIGAVCHGLAALLHLKAPDRTPLVQGRNVTGISNEEEDKSGLRDIVPFLIEDMLKQHGANYTKSAPGEPHVVTDGPLITGQNPASSDPAAQALLQQLKKA